ncbi:MAG TPA: GntR family transcriptional regulator [Candidatus Bathyarchaeia archaeon]|nr:GntR family transcriptional regulator [Candidatus Bathyarchaeia archaeon]
MVTDQNKALGYKSLTECVIDYLKQQLIKGDLHPGDEINLTALCDTLGVSRTPVREALVQLIKDGFIEEVTRKGFKIKKLELPEIRDIYVIGGLLESEVVQTACDRAAESDIDRLEVLLDESEAALARGEFAAYTAKNLQFNELIRSFCSNALLIRLVENIRERLYFAHNRAASPAWNSLMASDHREILALLRTRDKPGLDRLIRGTHWDFDRHMPFIEQFYGLGNGVDGKRP